MIQPTSTRLKAVNNTNIHTHGTMKMPVKLDSSEWIDLTFYVCDTQGPASLSCDASERLGVVTVNKSRNVYTTEASAKKNQDKIKSQPAPMNLQVCCKKTASLEQTTLLPGAKILVRDGKNWFPATVKGKTEEPRAYNLL